MCVQHGLKFMYKPVGSCHMYCTCCSITLHSKLYMFFLCILIIVNVIVFILFYLYVEPVFLLACLNKAIQITSVSSISATNMLPNVIRNIYIKNNEIHSHFTRNSNLIRIPKGNLNFTTISARIWNEIVTKIIMNQHVTMTL